MDHATICAATIASQQPETHHTARRKDSRSHVLAPQSTGDGESFSLRRFTMFSRSTLRKQNKKRSSKVSLP